ncbi:MAG: DUF485 domain-containing protein [Nitrospirota bacterium]
MGRREKGKRTRKTDGPDRDLTPAVGEETDVAPLGQGGQPAHERSADENPPRRFSWGGDRRSGGAGNVNLADWDRVAAREDFRSLIAAKRVFIIPATIFFVIYYFALPLLVGYAPNLMKTEVVGSVNLAYLFALSQFVMAWGLAAWYLRAAARFDRMAQGILASLGRRKSR